MEWNWNDPEIRLNGENLFGLRIDNDFSLIIDHDHHNPLWLLYCDIHAQPEQKDHYTKEKWRDHCQNADVNPVEAFNRDAKPRFHGALDSKAGGQA